MSASNPRRVVGYVRLSRADDDSTSVPRQRQIITAAASARGWDLVEVVEDVDVSASKRRLDRPGLDRVRALVRDGAADTVLVWRLDRLARSVVDFGLLLDEGLDVVSATEPLDTTSSMGRAMAEVLQVFAALESRTVGERVRSAIAYRVAGQRWRGGPAPYGYRVVPHPSGDGKALEVDADEARFVRMAADVVLDGGSLYRAARVLNDAGSKPRRSASWSLSSLRVVLVGDAVLGRTTRHGALLRDEEGLPVAPWEPVLPLEDVERLRALLARKAPTDRRRKAARLLSGLVVCSSCGKRLRVNRNQGGARYTCHGRSDGSGCESPVSIGAEHLDDFVERSLLEVVGTWPVVEHRETVRDAAGLAQVVEAIAYTTDLMREPGADLPGLVARLGELTERRDALQAAPAMPTVEAVETGETFAEAWAAREVDGRRALLASVVDGPVVLRPGVRGRRGFDAARVDVPWRWLDESAASHIDV